MAESPIQFAILGIFVSDTLWGTLFSYSESFTAFLQNTMRSDVQHSTTSTNCNPKANGVCMSQLSSLVYGEIDFDSLASILYQVEV